MPDDKGILVSNSDASLHFFFLAVLSKYKIYFEICAKPNLPIKQTR